MPLPILTATGQLPTGEALDRLRRAKQASGYAGLVLPCKAVHGSPGPILAVGVEPDWLTTYAYLPNLDDENRIRAALIAVLINKDDPRLGDEMDLLSKWTGVEVKFVKEEDYDGTNEAPVSNGWTR